MGGGKLLKDLKVTELKKELIARNLEKTGIKRVLEDRLKESSTLGENVDDCEIVDSKVDDQPVNDINNQEAEPESVSNNKTVKDDDSVPCIVKIEDQEDLDYDIDDVLHEEKPHEEKQVPVESENSVKPTNVKTPKRASNPAEYKNLWVSNIDKSTKAADLKQFFQAHGKVISASIVMRVGSLGGCFGHLKMNSNQDAKACINAINGKEWNAAVLKVELTGKEPPKRSDKKDAKKTGEARKVDPYGEQLLAKVEKRKAEKSIKRPAPLRSKARLSRVIEAEKRLRNMYIVRRSRRARKTLMANERKSRELRPVIERLKASRERESKSRRVAVRRESAIPRHIRSRSRENVRVRDSFRRINVRSPVRAVERPISPVRRLRREPVPTVRRRVGPPEIRRSRVAPVPSRPIYRSEHQRLEPVRDRYERASPERIMRRRTPPYPRRSPVYDRRSPPIMRRSPPIIRRSPSPPRRRPSPEALPFKRRYDDDRRPSTRDMYVREDRRPIERESSRRYDSRYPVMHDMSRGGDIVERRMPSSRRMSPPRSPVGRRERLSPRPSYNEYSDRRQPTSHKPPSYDNDIRVESGLTRMSGSAFNSNVDSKRGQYSNSYTTSDHRRAANDQYSPRGMDFNRKESRQFYDDRYKQSSGVAPRSPERRSYRSSPPGRSAIRDSDSRNFSSSRSGREHRWPDVVDYGHRSNVSSGSYMESQSSNSRLPHSSMGMWNNGYDKSSNSILATTQAMLQNAVNLSNSRHY